jgi:Amt family ammonium transporter
MYLGVFVLKQGLFVLKNTVNIVQNAMTQLVYWLMLIGFNLMYPEMPHLIEGFLDSRSNQPTRRIRPFMLTVDMPLLDISYSFHGMFKVTATLFCSSFRTKLGFFHYLLPSCKQFVIPSLRNVEMGRWLVRCLRFHILAGSTIVHAAGGFAASSSSDVVELTLGKYQTILSSVCPVYSYYGSVGSF